MFFCVGPKHEWQYQVVIWPSVHFDVTHNYNSNWVHALKYCEIPYFNSVYIPLNQNL